jgi:hypothetical protein
MSVLLVPPPSSSVELLLDAAPPSTMRMGPGPLLLLPALPVPPMELLPPGEPLPPVKSLPGAAAHPCITVRQAPATPQLQARFDLSIFVLRRKKAVTLPRIAR